MKKFYFVLSLCLLLTVSFFVNPVSASQKERNDYTFKEIEQMITEYLKENEYSLEVGTPEFTEFVIEQMNYDTDKKMAELEEYHLFCAYFAEYLYRLSLFENEVEEELIEDGNINGFSNNQTLLEISGETFSMDNIHDITLGEMEEEIENQEKIDNASMISAEVVPMATNTLNIASARSYAKKYYSKYNGNFPRYSNDCTNFVSQILQAGGRRQVSKLTTAKLTSDTKYWFIKRRPDNTWSRSSSWTVVTDLYSHLVRTQKGYSSTSKTNIIKNAKSGDVIQFKKDGASRYSHAMWIYSKSSSNLSLSGHTSNYLKRSFNAITGYKAYRIVKM